VVHIANLKKFVENPERFLDREDLSVPAPLVDSQGETVYEVDDIVNMKMVRNKRLFLIKWKGYDDPSWEPEKLLRESKDFEEHLDYYRGEGADGSRGGWKESKGRNRKARPK